MSRTPISLSATLLFTLMLGVSQPAVAQQVGEGHATEQRHLGSTLSTDGDTFEYRVLATSRTSTMERELNEAATTGFRFHAVMGGSTAFGGDEAVAIVSRVGASAGRYRYRLLATSSTSTMERELNKAAADGFRYRGQTVFESAFGGEEVVCILERNDAEEIDRSSTGSSLHHEHQRSRRSSQRPARTAMTF